jgi:energy-coupling factor transport system ATP-binding protein
MPSSLIKISEFSYAYPGAGDFVLKNIDMDINAGECHCIVGPTGSGKSTLFLALKRLLPPGRQCGDISPHMNPTHGANIGIVLQNPETQLLGTTVGNEAAFGLENLCVPTAEMEKTVKAALAAVGLDLPLDFPVSRLSMGQKYRLIMASVLAMSPSLVLLDEPGAQLDWGGIQKLKKIIFQLKGRGVGFSICEHRPDLFSDVIDVYWELNANGQLRRMDQMPLQASFPTPSNHRDLSQMSENILWAENLSSGVVEPVWSSATFDVRLGQRAGIYGDNGSGKTTLLRCIAGFLPPLNGKISVFGDSPAPQKLRGRMGCLFQNPQKQLFENTVFDEVSFPLKRMGIPLPDIHAAVDALLTRMGIQNLSRMSPHKLSFGQKHLVVLASALIFSPRLLILDDPFAGLDRLWRQKMLSVMSDISENSKTTWIWTGHLADEFYEWADLKFYVQGGKIVART